MFARLLAKQTAHVDFEVDVDVDDDVSDIDIDVVVFHTGQNTRAGIRLACEAFNFAKGVRRQIVIDAKNAPMRTLRSAKECKAAVGARSCPFRGVGRYALEDAVFAPPLQQVSKLKMNWR